MPVNKQDILDQLFNLLEPFNTKSINLHKDTEIMAGLGIDSVAVMDFIMEVEDAFDVEIGLNMLAEVKTIDDLAQVITNTMD